MHARMESAPRTLDVPMSSIADHLLAQGGRVLASPQSFAIRKPESMTDFTPQLQRLAQLPYEFLISYEDRVQRWVLTTGERGQSKHHFDGEADTRLSKHPDCVHNHPIIAGVTHSPPSASDLMTVAYCNEQGQPNKLRLLITPQEITFFGYEHRVSSDAIRTLWESIRVRYDITARAVEDLEYDPEQVHRLNAAKQELAKLTEAIIRDYSWGDPLIDDLLADYFSFRADDA